MKGDRTDFSISEYFLTFIDGSVIFADVLRRMRNDVDPKALRMEVRDVKETKDGLRVCEIRVAYTEIQLKFIVPLTS